MLLGGFILLRIAPWLETGLVVVVLSLFLMQMVRLEPPKRRGNESVADGAGISLLQNKIGRVVTPLRPVGQCEFDGRRVECTAEGQYVPEGKTVRVVRIEGMQPTVRVTDEV